MATTLSHYILKKYQNPYFLETGTSDASGVKLALQYPFEKIISIEINEDLQEKNKKDLLKYIESSKLQLIVGDSLLSLKNIIKYLNKPTTFWLDAHVDFGPKGVKPCPLYEELEAIKTSNINTHTIMIDDLRILGNHWGKGISLNVLKEKILEINPKYSFVLENGVIPNDILVATI
mgnify:CR=1 FL=1